MGPLTGIKVIELKGLGPGPYGGMLLADMGADVVVIERSSKASNIGPPSRFDTNSRGKKSIAINLKSPEGLEALLRMVESADVLFEGFRPGVAERLGFGPEICLQRNPALVYGRITGWGQAGPLSKSAGHDINYISLTGALAAIGGSDKPSPPLSLMGDFAGGALFLVTGILAALLEVKNTGEGQVIDAAIVDGAAHMMSAFYTQHFLGNWSTNRNANLIDGGAPFYDTYETADGKFISIGSIEPQFYSLLLEKTHLDNEPFRNQHDRENWPELRQSLVDVFKKKTRDEWCQIMEGTDVCFAPVLDFLEAPQHPHNRARQSFITIDGLIQPAPAPRFSRTRNELPDSPSAEGADTREVLGQWGFSEEEINELQQAGALT